MVHAPVENLVTAAQRGDTDAFSELVDRYYSLVHGLALSRTGNWSAAGDITQEVFLVAWSGLKRLRQPNAFPVWLRRIVRNTGTDWIRNELYRRRLAEHLLEQAQGNQAEVSDPASVAAREECLDQIGQSLQSLSPKLREAVVLYYLEGNSVAASAHALGITEDTMRKRLQLGCERLRDNYARQAGFTLQQLLPYSAQPHRQRIMAGLAAGPAVVHSDETGSTSGLTLGVHHLAHGGSWSALKEAGLAVPVIKGLGAGLTVLFVLCAGSAALFADLPSSATSAAGVDADRAESSPIAGMVMIEHFDDPALGSFIFVPWVFPNLPAYKAGLRPGDRIIRINGQPIHPGYRNDPALWPQGRRGATARFTAMRPLPGGAETELEFEVAWGAETGH